MMDGAARATSLIESEHAQQLQSTSPGGFKFIGELAAETGTDPKTIRYYEREGLLSPPRHGRVRTYMASDVSRLKKILMMRRLGISIAQIRSILESNADGADGKSMVNLLLNHLETLRVRQADVTIQLQETAAILEHYAKI